MAIRKSKINIDTEERSDFDNMMNDIENEVEEQQAEDGLVNRVPELKQLSEDIPIPSSMPHLNWSLPSVSTIRLRLPLAMPLTLSAERLIPSTSTSIMC